MADRVNNDNKPLHRFQTSGSAFKKTIAVFCATAVLFGLVGSPHLTVEANTKKTFIPKNEWDTYKVPDPKLVKHYSLNHFALTARQGGYVFKSDKNARRVRTELSCPKRFGPDEEVWFSFDTKLPDKQFSRWLLFAQFHQNSWTKTMPGNPPFSFELQEKSGRVLIVKWLQVAPETPKGKRHVLASLELPSERWHRFVGRVKFSAGQRGGGIEIWVNGVKEVDHEGVVGYPNSHTIGCMVGPYMKEPENAKEGEIFGTFEYRNVHFSKDRKKQFERT